MVLLIPVNSYIATKSKEFQAQQMKQKDKRIRLMTEVVQGIKVRQVFSLLGYLTNFNAELCSRVLNLNNKNKI
jgi:ATP-binding cassette subfamily C (CFTR/MRP) protein 2